MKEVIQDVKQWQKIDIILIWLTPKLKEITIQSTIIATKIFSLKHKMVSQKFQVMLIP